MRICDNQWENAMKKVIGIFSKILTPLVVLAVVVLFAQNYTKLIPMVGDGIKSAASALLGDITTSEGGQSSSGTASGGTDAASQQTKPLLPAASNVTAAPNNDGQATDSGSYWGKAGENGVAVYEYGKTLLSQKEQSFYDQLARGVYNIEQSVTIKSDLDPASAKKIYDYYIYDHSEVFYLNNSNMSYAYYKKGSKYVYTSYTFQFSYGYGGDKSVIAGKRSQLDTKILSHVAAASTTGDTERSLHDQLIRNCDYDLETASNPANGSESFTAYGALVNGSAVCDGYARAMKLLLSTAKIKSLYVTGKATNDGENWYNHAWNMVYTSGGWRYLDATFDDPVYIDPVGKYLSNYTVNHNYYNYTYKNDHKLGTFDLSDPWSGDSQNYAVMPAV
jgi:hypothetical protein